MYCERDITTASLHKDCISIMFPNLHQQIVHRQILSRLIHSTNLVFKASNPVPELPNLPLIIIRRQPSHGRKT